MNVDKDEFIRLLEVICETQSEEENFWGNESVKDYASRMLNTLLFLPLECVSVTISEEEALFLAEYSL